MKDRQAQGKSRSGRYKSDDTDSLKFIHCSARPLLYKGKVALDHDMRMLELGPIEDLSGNDKIDVWHIHICMCHDAQQVHASSRTRRRYLFVSDHSIVTEDDECADQQVRVPDRTRTMHRAWLSGQASGLTICWSTNRSVMTWSASGKEKLTNLPRTWHFHICCCQVPWLLINVKSCTITLIYTISIISPRVLHLADAFESRGVCLG